MGRRCGDVAIAFLTGGPLPQGLIEGRLQSRGQGGGPLRIEAIEHEGQRSVAEICAILWHAIRGAREAPELKPWLAPPHTDHIVALSRQRLGEYATRESIDRNFAFPGDRVWLIEIERAKGATPAAVAVWRRRERRKSPDYPAKADPARTPRNCHLEL